MPNLNLSDSRGRDAVVSGESVTQRAQVLWIDDEGDIVTSHRLLQSTSEHSLRGLKETFGDDLKKVGQALIDGDPEVDIERFGSYLNELSRVYVSPSLEVVHRIEQVEIVRAPDGEEKERRPRERPENNTDSEFPLKWTGKMLLKKDVVRQFTFGGKLQVAHVNGLTYDFLYDMAKELHDAESLLLIGAGPKGKDPLVFRRGSVPYRGFLEGRINGDRYALILHLSNMELKVPEPIKEKPKEVSEPEPEPKAAKKGAPAKKTAAKKKTKSAKKAATQKKAAAKKTPKKK